VVQVSRILGHASPDTTLRVYTHMFDHARHTSQLHAQIAQSQFAALLCPIDQALAGGGNVIAFPASTTRRRGSTEANSRTSRPTEDHGKTGEGGNR
jgi:hypothetical protein